MSKLRGTGRLLLIPLLASTATCTQSSSSTSSEENGARQAGNCASQTVNFGAYNLFICGDASFQNSETLGAIAVAGNVTANPFSFAMAHPAWTADGGFTAVVVGGSFEAGGGGGQVHGDLYYGTTVSAPQGYLADGQAHQGSPIDFPTECAGYLATSTMLDGLTASGKVADAGGTLTLSGSDPLMNVFSIPATVTTLNSIDLEIPAGAHAVVNVEGAGAIAFTNGQVTVNNVVNAAGPPFAGEVVFNLPHATAVSVSSYGFAGGLLAPGAAANISYTSIDGPVIALSLVDTGEFHEIVPTDFVVVSCSTEPPSCSNGQINCDDGNACTIDSCDPVLGCVHKSNFGAVCPSPNACFTATCGQVGNCFLSGQVSCDDGNPCTTDTCDPVTGCAHAPRTSGLCDSGRGCRGAEFCDLNAVCECQTGYNNAQ